MRFTLNGETVDVEFDGPESLLDLLRERLLLTGSKGACEQGECGSCTVLLDGEVVCSCLVMAAAVEQRSVVTVEGLADAGSLHRVQQAFLDHGAVQCGFCTPGFLVAAAALFDENPVPTSDEIREELSGNICRCTGYGAILRALESISADDD